MAESATSKGIALITGATGVIGPSVASALNDAGYCIRTFSRSEPEKPLFPTGLEVFRGDITDPVTIAPALNDVSIVVHLAGLLHIISPSESQKDSYKRVNVEGTANLVNAAMQAKVERIIFCSTIAVYGDSFSRVLDEDSPASPETPYAITKFEAEQIVLNARRPDGRPIGTVLRLAAVYGARLKGNYRRLLMSLAQRRFVPIGTGSNRRTLVYHKDVARATVIAASHPAAAGRVYNVTDGRVHTLNEIIATICQALGKKPPRISVPLGTARLAVATL